MSVVKNVHRFTSLTLFTIRSVGEKEIKRKESASFGKAGGLLEKWMARRAFSLDTRLETQGRRKEKKLT